VKGIGSRIRKHRKDAGLSQRALASAVGVTQPAVWCWEQADGVGAGTTPRNDKLVKIAKVLGVSVAELLFGKAPCRKRAA
jgi:transcriptional regulator with XRE-family HTH domain